MSSSAAPRWPGSSPRRTRFVLVSPTPSAARRAEILEALRRAGSAAGRFAFLRYEKTAEGEEIGELLRGALSIGDAAAVPGDSMAACMLALPAILPGTTGIVVAGETNLCRMLARLLEAEPPLVPARFEPGGLGIVDLDEGGPALRCWNVGTLD